ncbi:HAMP domain-containing histidine kinase [Flavobacterium sp. IMCC34852]|uniref:histidine kinase n=1 Tax=Flavobacterium rivulicola TaxID=2732161 RepID=A0A7Y3VYB3_9FLAO|nr:HAMP domain-containing sensor histidine kinase [Flavobacterium sp. IMCC34852]NNT71505.1 HAMP domain-containing histidine kinase [Flavobacterium sp. IMCC34852]
MNAIFLKKLKFEDRKVVHYTLLVCIILLQLIAVLIWYNETANENKIEASFESIDHANQVNGFTGKVNNAIIQSQESFNDYISTKNPKALDRYLGSLKVTSSLIDSLAFTTKNHEAFKTILAKRDKVTADILLLKSSIDSVISRQIHPNHEDVVAPFRFDRLNYNKVLDSIDTNTSIKIDSISRKGLLARLLAAFSGKIEIQKEQLNTVITMKYKDKVKTGTLEEQMKYLISTSNKYYAAEFGKLQSAFLNLRKKDLELVKFNTELLLLSQTTLPYFTNAAQELKLNSQQDLKDQLATNKAIRNYSIVAVLFLMFVVSLILFGFTRLAFEYEKRLTTAQEKIRQSLNFKNRIMGMISHEIRSPLSIIAIYSQKISATVKDNEIKETFNSVQFTTNSLLLLSNQILEYSKAENHRLTLKNKNFYLKTELEQIITAMTSLVESKGNKLKLSSNMQTDYEVYSDVAKMHQLFYNIIGNANKFTEKGLIEVTINQKNTSDYEVNLQVTIEDNGIGIAAGDLANIFESYYQGTVSNNVNDLGVGLGLNLCKEIVELFEGKIEVESQEGQGTKIVFDLVLSKV